MDRQTPDDGIYGYCCSRMAKITKTGSQSPRMRSDLEILKHYVGLVHLLGNNISKFDADPIKTKCARDVVRRYVSVNHALTHAKWFYWDRISVSRRLSLCLSYVMAWRWCALHIMLNLSSIFYTTSQHRTLATLMPKITTIVRRRAPTKVRGDRARHSKPCDTRHPTLPVFHDLFPKIKWRDPRTIDDLVCKFHGDNACSRFHCSDLAKKQTSKTFPVGHSEGRHRKMRHNVKIWPQDCKENGINMKTGINPYS